MQRVTYHLPRHWFSAGLGISAYSLYAHSQGIVDVLHEDRNLLWVAARSTIISPSLSATARNWCNFVRTSDLLDRDFQDKLIRVSGIRGAVPIHMSNCGYMKDLRTRVESYIYRHLEEGIGKVRKKNYISQVSAILTLRKSSLQIVLGQ